MKKIFFLLCLSFFFACLWVFSCSVVVCCLLYLLCVFWLSLTFSPLCRSAVFSEEFLSSTGQWSVLDKNSSEKIRQRPGEKGKAEARDTAQKKHQNKRKTRKTLTHQLEGKAVCEGKEALHTTEQVTKKVS